MIWLHEIRLVGLLDWVWFVVWLRRNEFSNRLCLSRYYPDLDRLVRDRNRAHVIAEAIAQGKGE